MRKTTKYFSCVVIKKTSGKCTKLHTMAAGNNWHHPRSSIWYSLFTSHIFVCCSLHTSYLLWIALSTQHQLRGCNKIPSFLQWTAPIREVAALASRLGLDVLKWLERKSQVKWKLRKLRYK